jgi:DNA recombination protein RmuC
LGNTLKAANNHYNDTVKGLVGTQGLHGKVERFQQLSTKANKEMVALEPIHSDIENDRIDATMNLEDIPAEPARLAEIKPIKPDQ